MAVIGPRFAEELAAAGVFGLPFSWDANGNITWGAAITPAQRATILAVIAAHNPSAPATDTDAVRDAYVAAKAAMTTFAADSTLANAKPALIKLGQCVEELMKYLNRRIA